MKKLFIEERIAIVRSSLDNMGPTFQRCMIGSAKKDFHQWLLLMIGILADSRANAEAWAFLEDFQKEIIKKYDPGI